MSAQRHIRSSDNLLVDQVADVAYDRTTREVTVPDGRWDIVVLKLRTGMTVLQTGLITRPVSLSFEEGEGYLCISLKPSVFVPSHPGVKMLDQGVIRPLTTTRTFWFEQERFEVPTFENAESLIEHLARAGYLVVDDLVHGIIDARPKAASVRTLQRRFLRVTGITWKHLELIHRANAARERLLRGQTAVDVAASLGYTDQSHLTRDLKQFFGRTPGDFGRARG